jgi:hypothetical protein
VVIIFNSIREEGQEKNQKTKMGEKSGMLAEAGKENYFLYLLPSQNKMELWNWSDNLIILINT